jgi:hypothetical protein
MPVSAGLVMYHLSPRRSPSWSKVLEREPARRMADKVAWHRTPKPGRWLNRAAIKLGVRSRQCLGGRWESLEEIEHPVGQEHKEWIERAAKMHWWFTPHSSSSTPTLHLKVGGRRGSVKIKEEICRLTARFPRNSVLR